MESNMPDFYQKHSSGSRFPQTTTFVFRQMALFGSTYVVEQLFSRLNSMKSAFRSLLAITSKQACDFQRPVSVLILIEL